uniref:Uncharacterized protein n=1 Tax=viral metagenome TaxID=1070528 RepID=A0A6C0JWQ6_9ZZZZ
MINHNVLLLSYNMFNHLWNRRENTDNLEQGRQFNQSTAEHVQDTLPYLSALQKIHLPGISSIVENMDTTRTSVSYKNGSHDEISRLENEFNKTLVQYNTVYKLFNESIVQPNAIKDLTPYLGKNIKTNDGNYSYINDYGYTHKYSTDAWANKDISCSLDTVALDTDVSFQLGPDMGIQQPCGMAGKNIQNTQTNEYAWVDIKGYKHIYSSDVWNTKTSECNRDIIMLSNNTYNAIPSGANMTSTDTCIQSDIDPNIWTNLVQLNDNLYQIAKQISVNLDTVIVEDTQLQTSLNNSQKDIMEITNGIQQDRTQLQRYSNSLASTEANETDSYLKQTMYYQERMIWFILLLTIISLMVYALVYSSSQQDDIIVLIVSIFILFAFARWIWSKIV